MKKQRFTIGGVVFWCVMALSGAAWCGDNGDGTVTVNGLVWLKDAGCLGYMNWNSAIARPKRLAHGQCDLTDNSKPGDWRLPTVDELKAVYPYKGQFRAVQASNYWSSSTYAGGPTSAWNVSMNYGNVGNDSKRNGFYVWPVRGGQ
jgi:hypothetical protein